MIAERAQPQCWRDDPAFQEALAVELAAKTKADALDVEYQRLWRDAVAEGVGDGLTAWPGWDNEVWPARRAAARAEKEWRAAKHARVLAEQQAIGKTQLIGLRQGRTHVKEQIEPILRQLQTALDAYERLQESAFDQYGAKLPQLGLVMLSARSIDEWIATIYDQNRFGDGRDDE